MSDVILSIQVRAFLEANPTVTIHYRPADCHSLLAVVAKYKRDTGSHEVIRGHPSQ
jgi:hypothetical protein